MKDLSKFKQIIKECKSHPHCSLCPYSSNNHYCFFKCNIQDEFGLDGVPCQFTPKELKDAMIKNKLKRL